MDLSSLSNGEMNEFHHLVLVASTNETPNALSHRETMKAEDHELFIQAMEKEIKRIIDKDIFEVVPRSRVPTYQKALRSV
eukprot:6410524-Ditylum_brightwellii.AAC.1